MNELKKSHYLRDWWYNLCNTHKHRNLPAYGQKREILETTETAVRDARRSWHRNKKAKTRNRRRSSQHPREHWKFQEQRDNEVKYWRVKKIKTLFSQKKIFNETIVCCWFQTSKHQNLKNLTKNLPKEVGKVDYTGSKSLILEGPFKHC